MKRQGSGRVSTLAESALSHSLRGALDFTWMPPLPMSVRHEDLLSAQAVDYLGMSLLVRDRPIPVTQELATSQCSTSTWLNLMSLSPILRHELKAVAKVAQPQVCRIAAVSQVSQPAGKQAQSRLEIGDTADLEVCATTF